MIKLFKKKGSALHKKLGIMNAVILIILIVYALSMVLMLLWGLGASLKSRANWLVDMLWAPKGWPWEWEWENYSFVLKNFILEVRDYYTAEEKTVSILGMLWNSIAYALIGAFVVTAANMIGAYLVAKFKYAFSGFVYTLVLITMVTPVIGTTPAMILFLQKCHLYDTMLGTYLMKFNFLGMYFLVFHASFKSISPEYTEAATIDGANEMQIFLRIMIPLIIPTFNTVLLIQFIGLWNDYNTALMYLPSHPTLSYGSYRMSTSTAGGMSREPRRLAACMIVALPIFVIFVLFRNKIMGNVTMGGVKE